ncbi:AAA family ATPase [candidate division KSB1 bacterium]|nr:AAA family ATPase [candidate division KSB1 bacterium]NIR68494.1 AAA family ATPase [candidate division KSB1 bacterium]NIS22508.1 AAA family ATPase [candidate division KSB1 bacterium]NIT69352.1 AAA family ATPase [candidate division KSB1 bacterium]NIU23013.1 AAA family ATPase [candidate division KSB1 bacterium]
MNQELSYNQLRKTFDPKRLGIESTDGLESLKSIIGQDRAVQALQFGLQIDGVGYNIYVAGPPGIGKMTSVQSFLEEVASQKDTPPDWCYVNNFQDPYNPKGFQLPAGMGCDFKKDMDDLIEYVRQELPKAFESEEYTNKREEVLRGLNERSERLSRELNEKAAKEGFKLQATPMGIAVVPMKDDEPLKKEKFESLPESERKELEARSKELQDEMQGTMKEIRKIERESQEKIKELDQQVALHVVGGRIEDLKEKYSEYSQLKDYLNEVQGDILENIDTFKTQQQEKQSPGMSAQQSPQIEAARELTFRKYQVNVLVDNSKQEGAPVIVELNPTYNNLLGRIEKEMQMGMLNTDFTMIRPGSLPRANGGFLVVPVEDVLLNFYSWDALKRALRASQVQIEELSERIGFMTTKSLRPQPIPLNVKVVLVGRPLLYHLLHKYDQDFPELFKVKADYDTRMSISDENRKNFMSFVSTYCEKENLKHFDGSATARLMEHALRLADDQEKLSTEFGHLADVIREASFWAQKEESSVVSRQHVKKALDEKVYRSNLIQERIEEMIERGMILIDTEAETVGQVNGLSVLNLGDYQFGKPNRITASISPGRDGVTDIEREVELGGPIHSKGVMILSGYLTNKYAEDTPLTLTARLVFEQSYEGIEGDSASSAELYAILSALAEAPIKQGIAVTGSVNQNGEVQAIGGINEKIEGFYDVCNAKGLSGSQGVVIPQSNVQNLMLREDVVEAVKNGKFHVWPVKHVDEGIEILTGLDAGESDSDGRYPKDTINERVRMRLRDFDETLKEFRDSGEKKAMVTKKSFNKKLG